MTASPAQSRPLSGSGGPGSAASPAREWLDEICPYLRSADGTWRAATPVREHCCWSAPPLVELPVQTQQRLCLTSEHAGCERYAEARGRREEALARDNIAPVLVHSARFVPQVSPVPVAVERGSQPRGIVRAIPRSASRGRLALVAGGLGVAAIVILGVAVLFGGRPGTPVTGLASPTAAQVTGPAGGSPEITATSTPVAHATSPLGTGTLATPSTEPASSVIPTDRPTGTPIPTAPPTPSGSDGPAASPVATPTIQARYVIREGDTLRTIAAEFGVTVRQLRRANDLGSPPVLTPGDELVIPTPLPSPTPKHKPNRNQAP